MLNHPGAARNVLRDPDVTADHGALSDRDTAQYRRTGVYGDVVLEYRMPRQTLDRIALRVLGEGERPERDSLIGAQYDKYI